MLAPRVLFVVTGAVLVAAGLCEPLLSEDSLDAALLEDDACAAVGPIGESCSVELRQLRGQMKMQSTSALEEVAEEEPADDAEEVTADGQPDEEEDLELLEDGKWRRCAAYGGRTCSSWGPLQG